MPIGAAIGIAGVAGGGASIIGANKASNAASDAADKNNALQSQIYQKNTDNLSPFMTRGNAAGDQINAALGLSGDPAAASKAFNDYANSTGYQFAQQSGVNAVNQSKATAGLLHSGSALKALQDRGTQVGQTYFGNYLNALQGQQQTGLSGANALAGVGTNYANATSANNDSAASATGNAALSVGQNLNALAGTALNAYGLSKGSSYGSGSGLPKSPSVLQSYSDFG